MEGLEEARRRWFFENSQSRRLRRGMAKKLGLMKHGWQNIKDEFPPYNKPMDVGIKKFKKTGASHKDVVEYKLRARKALVDNIKKNKEA